VCFRAVFRPAFILDTILRNNSSDFVTSQCGERQFFTYMYSRIYRLLRTLTSERQIVVCIVVFCVFSCIFVSIRAVFPTCIYIRYFSAEEE